MADKFFEAAQEEGDRQRDSVMERMLADGLLDEGRPKQHATMMVHPERTNLDEFLSIMSDFLNAARRGVAYMPIQITIQGNIQPVTELQQHWNGDTMEVHMDVLKYTFSRIED